MKILLSVCMLVTTTLAWAADPATQAPVAPATVESIPVAATVASTKGEVLEVLEVPGFTYLRLNTAAGEVWAAVPTAKVVKGDTVTIENASQMNGFESKTLKRTFPAILFGALGGAAPAPVSPHSGLMTAVDIENIKVAKATGPNAHTVAEIVTQSAALKDKTVVVSGKIVKYNPEIMDKNWIHLRDGSGSNADNTNDILVTTKNEAKIGDIVTVKGIVRTDKNFGAGYAYKVLIEDATLEK